MCSSFHIENYMYLFITWPLYMYNSVSATAFTDAMNLAFGPLVNLTDDSNEFDFCYTGQNDEDE